MITSDDNNPVLTRRGRRLLQPVITLYNNYLWSGETESKERTIFKPYKRGWRFIATDTWPPQDFETLQSVPPAPEPEPEPVEEIEESETEGAEEKA